MSSATDVIYALRVKFRPVDHAMSRLHLLKQSDQTVNPLAPITTAADDICKYFLFFFRENKMFQVNPARQRIHMKNQALCSLKDRSKKLRCLLQFLFGTLRVKF